MLVFFINSIGASEVDPGYIEFKPGDQPIHNTLLREGPPVVDPGRIEFNPGANPSTLFNVSMLTPRPFLFLFFGTWWRWKCATRRLVSVSLLLQWQTPNPTQIRNRRNKTPKAKMQHRMPRLSQMKKIIRSLRPCSSVNGSALASARATHCLARACS